VVLLCESILEDAVMTDVLGNKDGDESDDLGR
jgi:hypothetical protein